MATAQTTRINSDIQEINTRSLFPIKKAALTEEQIKNLEEAFPPVDPGFSPNGNRILVQLRSPVEKTKGGIIMTSDSQMAQQYQEQIGRVVAIGQAAFRNPANMEPWAEGEWFEVGDYVRVPKFGGDKTWTVYADDSGEAKSKKTLFVVFRDFDIIGTVYGNPLSIEGSI